MRIQLLYGLAAGLLVLFASCSEPTSVRRGTDSTGGKSGAFNSTAPLNPSKMASLSRYNDGGCGASVTDAAGVAHGYAIKRQNLPFAAPAIQHDATTGQGNGAVMRFSVNRPNGAPIAFTCWMPKTLSAADLIASMRGSKNGRWKALFRMLPLAPPIPDSAHRQPLSNEVKAFAAQTLAPRPSPTNPSTSLHSNFDTGCFNEHGTFDWYNEGTDAWLIIEVDVEVCDDGGDDIFEYVIDNGYSAGPYVVVDANTYSVTDLDSVSFTAEVVSDERLAPDGWQWTVADGPDPWTTACLGTAPTCTIQVHGSGFMSYAVDDGLGNTLSDTVTVYGNLAPDIELDDDDGDAPSSADSTAGPATTVELDSAESRHVYDAAVASGEWLYTQGCARCTPPYVGCRHGHK